MVGQSGFLRVRNSLIPTKYATTVKTGGIGKLISLDVGIMESCKATRIDRGFLFCAIIVVLEIQKSLGECGDGQSLWPPLVTPPGIIVAAIGTQFKNMFYFH